MLFQLEVVVNRLSIITATALILGAGVASAQDKPLLGLVMKANDVPFWQQMQKQAADTAKSLDVDLQVFAGSSVADNEAQVSAVESLISAGAKGILITPADPTAIVPVLAQARAAGIAVVALDTQTDPATGVDATYETDNYRAGELIGEWARAKFARNSVEPKVAMIDVSADHITVDVQRHNGFLKGFGIAVKGPKTWEEVSDPRIVAVGVGHIALDESRSTMENLLQANPDINLVYTVNETTAFGAIQAIKAAGLSEQITVVSIDGSCAGIDALKSGMLHATVQQFPKRMAELGVVALVDYVKNGKKPTNAGGKAATDAGTVLITSDTQAGIASIDVAEGQEACF